MNDQMPKAELFSVPILGRLTIVLVTLFMVTAGCARHLPPPRAPMNQQIRGFHDAAVKSARRVVILPIENSGEPSGFEQYLVDSLSTSLRNEGCFEVVQLAPEDVSACYESVAVRGRYDEYMLLSLQQKYNIDGVVFVHLNRYRPYIPMAADVIAHLVDARQSTVLASVDGSWDFSLDSDAQRFVDYMRRCNDGFDRTELAMQSPRMVATFIADELARRMSGN